tara:strand:- start:135 stop:254 length:120 start_codon:yes stop_codon:yes gene_type:complete
MWQFLSNYPWWGLGYLALASFVVLAVCANICDKFGNKNE